MKSQLFALIAIMCDISDKNIFWQKIFPSAQCDEHPRIEPRVLGDLSPRGIGSYLFFLALCASRYVSLFS